MCAILNAAEPPPEPRGQWRRHRASSGGCENGGWLPLSLQTARSPSRNADERDDSPPQCSRHVRAERAACRSFAAIVRISKLRRRVRLHLCERSRAIKRKRRARTDKYREGTAVARHGGSVSVAPRAPSGFINRIHVRPSSSGQCTFLLISYSTVINLSSDVRSSLIECTKLVPG